MKISAFSLSLCLATLAGMATTSTKAELLTTVHQVGSVRAYPNPWKVNQHSSMPMIFDQLPLSTVSTLRIFTISGELVRTVSGTDRLTWDLRNQGGQNVASGVYLYLVSSDGQQKTGKVVVIR